MSLRRACASLLGVVFCSALLWSADAQAQRRRTGTLIVETEHEGAEVFVDAELVGTLPLEPLELAAGNHTIRVSRPGFTEFTDVFRIRPRRETTVTVELLAVNMVLTIGSVPEGAQVFVDGQFSGETPVEVTLLEGEHSVRLRARGYREAIQTVEAQAGVNDTLEVALEALPMEERRALFDPPEPEWYEEPLTWVAVGAGAVAVAVGVIVVVSLSTDDPTQAQQFCEPSGSDCVRVPVDF